MLGKRSRTLQRTTSAREIGMGQTEEGAFPGEKPRPSVQVIGFNPKAAFDDVGCSSPHCLLTNVDCETACKGSAQVRPVLGGLSSLFQNKLTSVDESSAAHAKTVHGKFVLNDLDPGKKSQCASVDLPAYRNLPVIDFLDECYMCKQRLGPEQDIYMYRGDRAFCSVECRWQQILLDERTEKCASAALNRPSASPARRSGHRSGVEGSGTATAA